MKNDNFEQSHSAEKSGRGGPLGFSNIYYVPIYQKIEGGPFGTIRKVSKESLIVPKKIQFKNTQIAKVGFLSCFQGSGRRFYNFGWGSKLCGMFWSN